MNNLWSLIMGVASGLIFGLFSVEIGSWARRMAEALVRRAARRLPNDSSDRFEEESLAILSDLRSGFRQLLFAFSITLSIGRFRRALKENSLPDGEDQERDRVPQRFIMTTSLAGGFLLGMLAGGLTAISFDSISVGREELVIAVGATIGLASLSVAVYQVVKRRKGRNGDERGGKPVQSEKE